MKKCYYLIPVLAVSITAVSYFVYLGLSGIMTISEAAICIVILVLAYNTAYTLKLNEALIKQNKELLQDLSLSVGKLDASFAFIDAIECQNKELIEKIAESQKSTNEWIGRCYVLEETKEFVVDERNQLRKDYNELKRLSEIQFLR